MALKGRQTVGGDLGRQKELQSPYPCPPAQSMAANPGLRRYSPAFHLSWGSPWHKQFKSRARGILRAGRQQCPPRKKLDAWLCRAFIRSDGLQLLFAGHGVRLLGVVFPEKGRTLTAYRLHGHLLTLPSPPALSGALIGVDTKRPLSDVRPATYLPNNTSYLALSTGYKEALWCKITTGMGTQLYQ